ncbi:MAG: HAD family hydrolase [Alphaproteobacteria bacterium]|nr:HAD family hydrolase [Alphaproteobacteria bacterium]
MSHDTPRAILFDWDKTLVDNWAAIHLAVNATMEAMGQAPWTLEETHDRVRESMGDSFPRMFGAEWPRARDVFYKAFRKHHLRALRPLPGAESALQALRRDGYYLGIVSNKQGDLLRSEIAHLEWRTLFDGVVGASDAARDKPAREPVELALAGGPPPGPAVWFVGDAGIDMACARAAGCVPVLIGGADPGTAEFSYAQPIHHIPDFEALLMLVRRPQNTIFCGVAPRVGGNCDNTVRARSDRVPTNQQKKG